MHTCLYGRIVSLHILSTRRTLRVGIERKVFCIIFQLSILRKAGFKFLRYPSRRLRLCKVLDISPRLKGAYTEILTSSLVCEQLTSLD